MKSTANKWFKQLRKKDVFRKWRFYVVYGTMIIALLGLIAHLCFLQLVHSGRLIEEGDKRSIRYQKIIMPRGTITDRAGRILAVSIAMQDVWADPKVINANGGVDVTDSHWQALARSIDMSVYKLAGKLNYNHSRFTYLARQVSESVADYIRRLGLQGIYFSQSSKRFYPAGDKSAQLIGFTDIDGNGAEGLERSLDSLLKGESGKRVIRRDRFGRVIEDVSQELGERGEDIALTIDERLQNVAYRELDKAVTFNKADSGTAVLIDVKTGEILAMATSPSYNPNNRSQIDNNLLRNRAVTDSFEPGSTVKPLVIMAALKNKIATTESVVNTQSFYVNQFEIKDVSPQPSLTLAGILQKSSNVGVSRLALQMKPEILVELYSNFGLGQPTNLNLGGEAKGTIADNRSRWSNIERAAYAYGYGLAVTPLQLARAYAAIGNYGHYKDVVLYRLNRPTVDKKVMSPVIVRTVIDMMKEIAESGSGMKASVPGYHIAVKTGTAKKVGSNGKYVNEYVAYTAGIAPVLSPRYSLVVIIDNPKAGKYYGGAVSAPVFGRIMGGVLRTMNIEPDKISDIKSSTHLNGHQVD